MECDYCRDKLESNRFIKIVERKRGILTGRKFNYCLTCYGKFLNHEIKDLNVKGKYRDGLELWKGKILIE